MHATAQCSGAFSLYPLTRLDSPPCHALILAEAPDALVRLGGISLLERLLRNLQRLGFRAATILSTTPEAITAEVAKPSWAREGISFQVRSSADPDDTPNETRGPLLIVSAATYLDPRLLRATAFAEEPCALFDSNPPAELRFLLPEKAKAPGWFCDAALVTQDEQSRDLRELMSRAAAGEIGLIDVEREPRYVVSLRRDLRPIWFAAPKDAGTHRRAEALLLDAAQNGTRDLPAIVHGPIETWLVARLCRTAITPMQITLFTAAISAIVTVLFWRGHLAAGIVLALIVGVLDGVDGKQARVKVETTELGKREHVLDYVLELSWWTALAHHFSNTHALPNAYSFLLLLVGSDWIDRVAKAFAKKHTGRNLDDVAAVDGFVRLIGGRRNIYVWLLGGGLVLGAPDKAFALLCVWGAATALVHVLRAFSIARA